MARSAVAASLASPGNAGLRKAALMLLHDGVAFARFAAGPPAQPQGGGGAKKEKEKATGLALVFEEMLRNKISAEFVAAHVDSLAGAEAEFAALLESRAWLAEGVDSRHVPPKRVKVIDRRFDGPKHLRTRDYDSGSDGEGGGRTCTIS